VNRGSLTPLTLSTVRESRKLSQTALAAACDVTQAAISKYEAGITAPSDTVIDKLADALRCPVSLLRTPISYEHLPITFFRKTSRVGAKETKAIRARVNLCRLRLGILLRSFELAEEKLLLEDTATGPSASDVAQALRVYWNVPPGPIDDLTALVESYGVVVVPMDFGTDAVDGLSLYKHREPLPPLIFLNPNVSPDRWRLSLAHELGHIVLHHHLRIPPSEQQLEEEAFEFAAELLMPRQQIQGQLRQLSIRRLAQLKVHWRVAMAAILMRAKKLGYVAPRRERQLWMQLRRGGAKHEPIEIDPERPTLIQNIIEYHTGQLGYSVDDLSKLLLQHPDELRAEWGIRRARLQLA